MSAATAGRNETARSRRVLARNPRTLARNPKVLARSRRAPGVGRHFRILAALFLLVPSPLSAQIEWEAAGIRFGPTLVGEGSDVTPGLRVELDLARRKIMPEPCWPRRGNLALEANLPVTVDADRNPESLRAELRGGLLVALFCAPEGAPGEPPPLEAPRRWGFVEVSFEGRVEALQAMDDADLTLGAVIAYEHDQDRLWFVPSLGASFGLVECLGCDLDEDEDSWVKRMDLDVAWSVPLAGVMPAPLDPLRLRVRGRYFAATGMGDALKSVREDVGAWGSVELAYLLNAPSWLQEVHVAWRGGELPIRLRSEEAWEIGVTLAL